MRVLITGAAGNLGSMLAKHLMNASDYELLLMYHKNKINYPVYKNTKLINADLSIKQSLYKACKDVDCIVHFAGVLFKAKPEKFLPQTNTGYFKNLLDVAIECNVKKVILCSFPHVEGETGFNNPATGHLNGKPQSVHAKTRLEEEKYLFEKTQNTNTVPVSIRPGMIYSKGILMIDAAKWLAKYWLLGVWKKPTQIHLISLLDFLDATEACIRKNTSGIYHLGDDGKVTLQEFLDIACKYWGYKKPWRMPLWLINTAATLCEIYSGIFDAKSPLTKDFIKIGKASYYGDTTRMKNELLLELKYKDIFEGKILL
ncbi:MAG: hypothetical protein Kow0068_07410 [Marinilabiliales bacterium]